VRIFLFLFHSNLFHTHGFPLIPFLRPANQIVQLASFHAAHPRGSSSSIIANKKGPSFARVSFARRGPPRSGGITVVLRSFFRAQGNFTIAKRYCAAHSPLAEFFQRALCPPPSLCRLVLLTRGCARGKHRAREDNYEPARKRNEKSNKEPAHDKESAG